MSELISGKEALIALANGEDVLWRTKIDAEVKNMKKDTPNLELVLSDDCNYRFWIKPRTITLNGIEVPAPFEPEHNDEVWYLTDIYSDGYWNSKHREPFEYLFGAWRTEEEIKQVVAALRSVFGKK